MKFRVITTVVALSVTLTACASHSQDAPSLTDAAAQPAKAGAIPPANPNEVYKPKDRPVAENMIARPDPTRTTITINESSDMLGNIVRKVGEQAGGNLVLMNGVENRVLRGIEIKKRSLSDTAAILTAKANLVMEEDPHYYFLYPSGYEQLLNVSVKGRLDARYSNLTTDAVFGSGLPLCTVFMWMSYALHMSIVTDNSIGDARCGELALAQAPFESAIDAILKSARVVALQADSTPEYIFLSTPGNLNPQSLLLDEGSLDESQRALLDKKVSLALPRPLRSGKLVEVAMTAAPLETMLAALSEQLGVQVVAEKGLEKFPVNPLYLHEVRLKTAMDLILRQWLEANYGYQVLSDRIVIRRK